MNDDIARLAEMERRAVDRGGGRPPPKAVCLVVGVWGQRFVYRFLELCLPTLLAPGNIPAVAAELPSEFIILTRSQDEPIITNHPIFAVLAATCAVTFIPVDDLVVDGTASTTLTLSYARAVRAKGQRMLDTCFILLVSDYIMADGSLRSVLARMRAGASAVLAGNFQIVEEDVLSRFRGEIDPEVAASFTSRDLIQRCLASLHPATLANMASLGLSHNQHTNRLFWRVDDYTIIGRFYLLHPICIRPETTDFAVGASFDYSFVPEMCPSNNVTTIDDSDDYFVVEMQPRYHEWWHLRLGPITPRKLGRTLKEWTTAQQRENVRFTFVYHAQEVPATIHDVIAEADAFIGQVRRKLATSKPKPYRFHRYWIGAMAVLLAQSANRLAKSDVVDLINHPLTRYYRLGWLLQLFRFAVFGRPPFVHPWHPLWLDFRRQAAEVTEISSDGRKRLLFVCKSPKMLTSWLHGHGGSITRIGWDNLVSRPRKTFSNQLSSFDACYVVLQEEELTRLDHLIDHALPMVKPGGKMIIAVFNPRSFLGGRKFSEVAAIQSARFARSGVSDVTVGFVPMGAVRGLASLCLRRLGHFFIQKPFSVGLLAAIAAVVPGLITVVCNLLRARKPASPTPHGVVSSMLVTLSVTRSVGLPPRREARPAYGVDDPENLVA